MTKTKTRPSAATQAKSAFASALTTGLLLAAVPSASAEGLCDQLDLDDPCADHFELRAECLKLDCLLEEHDVPATPSVWPFLEFTGGCHGTLSKTKFESTFGGAEVETEWFSIEMYFAKIASEKTYYEVTCDIQATPFAQGEGGLLRTVWLVEDGDKTASCRYSGLPYEVGDGYGAGSWCKTPPGRPAVASTMPQTGSLDDSDGEADIPGGVLGCWDGTTLKAEGTSYQSLTPDVEGSLKTLTGCEDYPISWTSDDSSDESLNALAEFLNSQAAWLLP